jgi:translocation and assembly module TamB
MNGGMNKRRRIFGFLIAILAVFVGLVALCIVVLNTKAFRDFLKSEIQEQALKQAGTRVDIGGVETHWTRLSIDLMDIVVHGRKREMNGLAPLLQAKDLNVSIRFLSLLRGRVELSDLILDEPVVHIRIDAWGNSNLPVAPQSTSHNTTAEVFDLEIEDCAIRSGQIYYNDAQIPLDAELHDLKFKAGYGQFTGKYTGSLSYEHGRLWSRELAPIGHAMQVQFTADRSGISITPLILTSGASHLTLNARLTNYANPVIGGTYSGDLFTSEIARALRMASLPIGDATLEGSFGYRPAEQRSFLPSLELQGHARSSKLILPTNQKPLDLGAVSAAYQLKDANLKVSDLSADILGGHARGDWEMLHIGSPDAASRLDASLDGISLARASDSLAPPNVQRIPLVGTAKLDARASWAGSLDSLIAHLRLAISNPQEIHDSRSVIPVSGLLQADYDGVRNTVSFGQSHLQMPSTKASIAGQLSSRRSGNSNISVLIATSDLRELSSVVALIENASPRRQGASIPELGGSATVRATVTGTARNPRIQGQVGAQNLSVDRSHWKLLSVGLAAEPSKVSVQNGMLSGDSRGQIAFDGSAGLRAWALTASSPISLHVKVTNVAVADAEKLAELHYPISGNLSATVSVKGTRDSPETNGTVSLVRGAAWNEPINNLTLNANSTKGAIDSTVRLQIPAGTVSADASYKPATQEYKFRLNGAGLQLARVGALQRSASLQGALAVSAMGEGTIQNPALQMTLTIPKLQVQDQVISNIDAQIAVAQHHASITVQSAVDRGSVEAKGDVDLAGNRYATAKVDVRALPIASALAAYLPEESSKITGQTEIHLSLSGPLKYPAQMEAHLDIPTLSLGYGKAQLALAQPLRADYRNGAVTLMPTRVAGTGTNLTFGGTIPIRGTAAYSLAADGSMDLSVLQQFAPDVSSSGQVIIHVKSSGSSAPSAMQGQIELKNVILSTASIPVGIEGLNAQIKLTGDRADIENFSGAAGGGSISASGFFIYGHDASFNVALNAQSVRIRYPQGLRSVLSGQLNLRGSPASSMLTGRVLVDRLSFTQQFDLANFAGSFSEDSSGAPQSAFQRALKLNVAVQSAQDIDLASSKLSMGGSANLMLTGTLADPVVLGRIALTSGEVFFLGKRFEVQSGTIEFANPARTEPVLNLHVTTTVEQYNVTLTLSGPIERLKTNYTSDPALPPADIIHLLAFGNTQEEAASAPGSSVSSSAESVLAQGVSSQVAGKLENVTGISQLTIDPLAADNTGNPAAQVAIQERVTGSLLLTFSTDVTSTQSQTVELQYQFNKRLSVTVLRDQNGGYGIDLRVHREF